MPSGFATLDTNFPQLEGMSDEQRNQTLTSYLYQLLENLRYVLNNLGEENINENDWKKITNAAVFTALGQEGATIINGANISTGSINADLITTGELQGINIRGVDIYGAMYHGGDDNSAQFFIDAGGTGAVLKFRNAVTDTDLFVVEQDAYGGTISADVYLLNRMILSADTNDSKVYATGNWRFASPVSFHDPVTGHDGSDLPTRTEVQAMIDASIAAANGGA